MLECSKIDKANLARVRGVFPHPVKCFKTGDLWNVGIGDDDSVPEHEDAVYREDGPSLPMGQQLCRHRKPQVLPPLLLLRVFRVHLRRRPRRRTILIVRNIIK